MILRMVATIRYPHLKSQELHEALMEAHETIGFEVEDASAQQVALLMLMPAPSKSLPMLSPPG